MTTITNLLSWEGNAREFARFGAHNYRIIRWRTRVGRSEWDTEWRVVYSGASVQCAIGRPAIGSATVGRAHTKESARACAQRHAQDQAARPCEQSYSESMGHPGFDWNHALDMAISGDVTTGKWIEMCERGVSWVTCACGNQCAALPRSADGMPLDTYLRALGSYFSEAVRDERYQDAKWALSQIEERAGKLLQDPTIAAEFAADPKNCPFNRDRLINEVPEATKS